MKLTPWLGRLDAFVESAANLYGLVARFNQFERI